MARKLSGRHVAHSAPSAIWSGNAPWQSRIGTPIFHGMKVATWNVNGIRARASQVREWLKRERLDVVCLQELKAEAAQIPDECKLAEYHAYWHGRKGYSGVALQIRRELVAGDPVFGHPAFDIESRIVQFLKRLTDWAYQLSAEGRELLVCGHINIA